MSTITPCLWFDGTAKEAANFYASVLPDSHVDSIHRAPSDYPSGKVGDVLTVEFTLMSQPFVGLNGGFCQVSRQPTRCSGSSTSMRYQPLWF
jgi:predicted 3-demethylubiquinone-9 3-methyltransferase (glyoxalase superfamily)